MNGASGKLVLGGLLTIVGFSSLCAGIFDWYIVLGGLNNRLVVALLGKAGDQAALRPWRLGLINFAAVYAANGA